MERLCSLIRGELSDASEQPAASSSSRPQVGLGSFPEETFPEFFHVFGNGEHFPFKGTFLLLLSANLVVMQPPSRSGASLPRRASLQKDVQQAGILDSGGSVPGR